MITKTHNSIEVVRGLALVGQVDKMASQEAPLDSIYATSRTWFPDFK